MSHPIEYRGYKITKTDNGWSFVHEDYDGAPEELYGPPADDRHGWGKDLVKVLAEIDELEDAA